MCIFTNLCSLINWRRYIEEIRIGVALATLISQILSAISITIYSKLRYKDIFLFSFKEYVIDTSLLKITILMLFLQPYNKLFYMLVNILFLRKLINMVK